MANEDVSDADTDQSSISPEPLSNLGTILEETPNGCDYKPTQPSNLHTERQVIGALAGVAALAFTAFSLYQIVLPGGNSIVAEAPAQTQTQTQRNNYQNHLKISSNQIRVIFFQILFWVLF